MNTERHDDHRPHRHGGRRFDGMWVEREVASLDVLAAVPTDVLARQVSDYGRCFNEPGPLEPPDPPGDEPSPDRWLAAQYCDGCPVQRECLERELRDNGEDTRGVWGGLAEDDRRELVAQWEARPARSYLAEPETARAAREELRRYIDALPPPDEAQALRIRRLFGGGF